MEPSVEPLADAVTIPEAARRLGINLDKLRRAIKRNPAAAGFILHAGDRRVVREADFDKLKALAGANA